MSLPHLHTHTHAARQKLTVLTSLANFAPQENAEMTPLTVGLTLPRRNNSVIIYAKVDIGAVTPDIIMKGIIM